MARRNTTTTTMATDHDDDDDNEVDDDTGGDDDVDGPLSVRGAQPHPLQQQQRREVRLWARPQPHPLPGDYDSDGVTGDYDDVR